MTKFELGTLHISSAAADALAETGTDVKSMLARHQGGDWGHVEESRRLRNEWALTHGGLIGSRYTLPNGDSLLVNTDATQPCTWVKLEAEYQGREVSTLEGYAIWAESYDREHNPLIEAEEPYVDPILAQMPAAVALDAGTGTGRYARRLARRGVKVHGVDLCPEMLTVARRKARAEGLGIGFQTGALANLPFRSERFDLVVCSLVLCHLPDLDQPIGELARVTRPGGHLLITDFHPGAVALGWRTVFGAAEARYLLPNSNHTRAGYLAALEAAGFDLLDAIDLRVRDIPAESAPFYGKWVHEAADQLFGLIISAQKVGKGQLRRDRL
jgi:ubiquinone/menaquinone biosynthesis C-methylase UbiE